MAIEKEKFLIIVKSGVLKPQQKTVSLGGQPWEIEWSTSSNVPMSIDFFNMTVGNYSRTGEGQTDVKKIEEYWRVTGIPGHARKIRYGSNVPDATSTSAKPVEDGIFVVKITGMSTITEGLHAESGAGLAVVKLVQGNIADTAELASSAAREFLVARSDQPVVITNELLMNLLDLSEDEESRKDA
jgi:hypothetical protein